jgi:hypothetical protein
MSRSWSRGSSYDGSGLCNGRLGKALLVLNDQYVLSAADAQLQTALDQLFLAHFAQTIGIACSTRPVSLCCTALARVYSPLLRHRILTWLPLSGRVNASRVGAKNMASSSGWAMSSKMRLLRSVGKDALRVLEYIQKPKRMAGTEAQASQFMLRDNNGWFCRL